MDLVHLDPGSVKMIKFDQIQIQNIAVRGHLSPVICKFPLLSAATSKDSITSRNIQIFARLKKFLKLICANSFLSIKVNFELVNHAIELGQLQEELQWGPQNGVNKSCHGSSCNSDFSTVS